MEWIDTTSYSRGGDRTPTTWTARVGSFRITVTCGHIYYPGKWVMHFHPLFDAHPLEAYSLEEAKQAATGIAYNEILKALEALNG